LIFPSIVGLVILFPYFIDLIPRYLKWEPALLSLAFFSINAALSSVSTPLTNALNAIGKIKTTLYLMVFWTIATWVITPLAIYIFGFNGVAIASAVISCSVVIVVYLVKKHIKLELMRAISFPLLGSVIMGLVIYFISPILIKGIFSLIFMILIGAMIYFFTILLFAKKQFVEDLKLIKENIKN